MKRTMKVKLDRSRPDAHILSVVCCNKRKWFLPEDFEPGWLWHCTKCGNLILVVDADGSVYYAGKKAF